MSVHDWKQKQDSKSDRFLKILEDSLVESIKLQMSVRKFY